MPWTDEEHRLFLLGLAKHGKGDWRSIARNFVPSRTPTQIASHAQKHFIRLNSLSRKDKSSSRRASIHDITNANALAAATASAAAAAMVGNFAACSGLSAPMLSAASALFSVHPGLLQRLPMQASSSGSQLPLAAMPQPAEGPAATALPPQSM